MGSSEPLIIRGIFEGGNAFYVNSALRERFTFIFQGFLHCIGGGFIVAGGLRTNL